jgi:Flp pilus assembly pilin Flp
MLRVRPIAVARIIRDASRRQHQGRRHTYPGEQSMFDKMFITLQLLRGDFAAKFEDEEGATMVEYGLLVAFIAIIALAGVTVLGQRLLALFNSINF